MLVGEFPSEEDERLGQAFTGSAGMELNRLLHEAGILRSECYSTYVLKVRPPFEGPIARTKKEVTEAHSLLRDRYVTKSLQDGYAELLAEIEMVQPNIIVAFGNIAMWALTEKWGVLKWRGSLLQIPNGPKVIPTISPSALFREWPLRALVLSDLRRVKRHMTSREYVNRPEWRFILTPSFELARTTLTDLIARVTETPTWLEFDLETSISTKHIRCASISWSRTEAICIPITDGIESYWTLEEEALIVYLLYKLLTHPNAWIRGQNLLFDCQYTYRYWCFIPNVKQDTMISQHSIFCALPKGLDFLASLYSDFYVNWKMEEHE